MSPILSICIPTYNRKKFLLENLKVLMPQVLPWSGKIEVLINDNASTDGTFEILMRLCDRNEWHIDLKKNKETIYLTDNFKDVISRAKGKYIYLMGDDDIVSPDFINIILPILESNVYSIIHFNRLNGDGICSNNHLHDLAFRALKEELLFEDFVSRVMSSPNFISSLIFSIELWDKGAEHYRKDRYYGYEFLSRVYFPAIGTKCLYYYMPLILMRNPVRTWAKYGFLYTMVGMYNIFEDLDKLIPGLKEKWIHRTRHTHFYDFKMSLADIGRDTETYRPYKAEILNICANRRERFLAKVLLTFPLGGLTSRIYVRILKYWRLFRKKYSLIRKVDF